MVSINSNTSAYIHSDSISLSTTACYIHVSDPVEPDIGGVRFVAANEQRIEIPNNVQYQGMDMFTITTFLKFDAMPDGSLMGVMHKPSVINFSRSAALREVNMGVYLDNGSLYSHPSPTFTVGKWHSYTITYDGTNLKWYMDGSLFYTVSIAGRTLAYNTNTLYLGYHNSYGYGSFDQALLRIYNYALDLSEIEALSGRCKSSVQPCYVHITDGIGDIDNSTWAYIYSPISSTNPGIWNESLVLAFGVDAEEGHQPCYINSGDFYLEDFDMIIDIDNTRYTKFDSVIVVQGRSSAISDIVMGEIVYPITRQALLFPTLLTRYNPGTIEGHVDAWMQTYLTVESVNPAYVHVNEFIGSVKGVYLHGYFQPIESTVGCYVVNDTADSSIGAYMEGYKPDAFDVFKFGFVCGTGSNLTNDISCYIEGGGTIVPSMLAYISGPHPVSGYNYCHIVSAYEIHNSHIHSHIIGHGFKSGSKLGYLYGHYMDETSQSCYIHVNEKEEANIGLFINSPYAYVSSVSSYIYNLATGTSSVLLYLKSDRFEDSLQQSFIRGWQGRRSHVLSFIAAPLFDLTDSQSCYVVNNNPQSSIGAYIVCGPMSNVMAYIASSGSKSSVQFASIT